MAFIKQENPGPLVAPKAIVAKTPQGLRRAMLRNNVRLRAFVIYQDIQFVDGRWYAWYYEKPDRNQSIDSMVSEANGND